ncbi:hypothetical protein Pmani_015243 [Petrolisthes manimaculis]|uniref:Thioredoxin-related transmembrane protein 1 n=1 Tax=Petrolisthes manimaculis TaxID=1843537 RepID=A0AAE1PU37_9EUCA|nr:hypothetical protein Pmani_015243 [Petrolisthes manimaculis]
MATDRLGSKILFLLVLVLLISQLRAKSSVVELNEDNWHQMLEGEWMVEFFAPWCPACKALKPIWEDFGSWSDDLSISVGAVDVTNSPGLSGRFMVTALPTIYHVKDGVFRQYRGSRDKDEFMSFVEEKRWEEVEVVPAWKSPGSLQMSIVAQFFKLSMVLRSVHSVLVEDYGLPTWGSYLVFALATIFVGALLGLVLVCIIDFVFPPKAPGPSPVRLKVEDDEEDLVENSEALPENNIKEEAERAGKSESEGEGEENEEEEAAKSGDDEGKELSQAEEEEEEEEDDNNEEKEEPGSVESEEQKDVKSSPGVRRRRARKD